MSDIPQLVMQWKNCGLEMSWLNALNIMLLLLLIPILDFVVVPLLRHMVLQPSILKCLGMGGIFTFLSVLSLFTLEGVNDHYFISKEASDICVLASNEDSQDVALNGYWLLLPILFVTLAEILIFVPSK